MVNEKIAVVTGANKGIGYAIVEGLCKKYNGIVYLTARSTSRGEEAVAKLKEKGFSPKFHQLDVTDQASVDKFRDHIKSTYGGLDVLVNNAGVAIQDPSKEFTYKVEETLKINYFGVLRVCDALFPLLRQNAKVVTISSAAGFPKVIKNESLREKFLDKQLTEEGITKLMEKFISDAKSGKSDEVGWGKEPYLISKVGVSALSIAQQKVFDKETPFRNIAINHVHPGYVDTDMTQHKGALTLEEGAAAALHCILEANFKGQYVWEDCQLVDWYGETMPPIKGFDSNLLTSLTD